MSIARPQGRAGATKFVRIEDGDRNGVAVTIEANPRTQTRAPMPAYKTPPGAWGNNVPAVGRAKAAAGIR
jgi:hypothetical protein